MKKLLSLLSVLTISGTAIPTTIAASPYQKEETIKNSDINYQQTNNLENLNRNKRGFWDDIKDTAKKGLKKVVEFDSSVRQAVQNKTIEVLESGKLGIFGEIGSAGGKKVKEAWDKYDQWKLDKLS